MYSYQLYDSIRETIQHHPGGLMVGQLTDLLNTDNHAKNSYAYKNLRHRVVKACKKLAELDKIVQESKVSEIKTKYYIFKPKTA